MNDLKTLRDAWGTPDAPSSTASTQARAALIARGTRHGGRRFRLSGLGIRVAAVGAFALVILAAVTVAENLGGTGAEVPVASAAVLEQAAVAAEKKPFTAPRDDQWIYVEDRVTWSDGKTETFREWRRADGLASASTRTGRLMVETLEPNRGNRPGRTLPGFIDSYKSLAALPTDPEALLRWAYKRAENITGSGMNEHGDVYLLFNGMLRGNLLPPELEGAIFRALKQVPGVTVLDTVDVLGRPALALGLGTSDWLYEELLLDKETYAYRGERSTVVRDATIDPFKAGNSKGEVKKGSRVVAARVVTAIVDKPGERP
jgi:hypothetical protein